MRKITAILLGVVMLGGCGSSGASASSDTTAGDNEAAETTVNQVTFNADSALQYVSRQVEFGPRIPGTAAHKAAADWLRDELRRHGAKVTEQTAEVTAFDGTRLPMHNIMGSYNPEAGNRLLLLAHYDTRPWADADPDPANHNKPIDGANDGASGVGVLLETARMLGASSPEKGIDILFVDCEDYGTEGDDDSWALGARYFAQHPILPGYRPAKAVLLDMVGGTGAVFPAEYYSRQAAPQLDDAFRSAAAKAGHQRRFPRLYGGAVNDDHIQLIEAGIPAIDIIDYRAGEGFCPTWHTIDDNMRNIDKETLRAVGESLFLFINEN